MQRSKMVWSQMTGIGWGGNAMKFAYPFNMHSGPEMRARIPVPSAKNSDWTTYGARLRRTWNDACGNTVLPLVRYTPPTIIYGVSLLTNYWHQQCVFSHDIDLMLLACLVSSVMWSPDQFAETFLEAVLRDTRKQDSMVCWTKDLSISHKHRAFIHARIKMAISVYQTNTIEGHGNT